MAEFGLSEYLAPQGRIILRTPPWDFDSFPKLAERLLRLLSATVLEKQLDADMHSWLIDFEGCPLLLRAEHYSGSIWIEALSAQESEEELIFLAQLFARGI
ncbi:MULTISPECIES: DUF3630 family protein [unclassified Vibrio]|uniref:DUF3630 family protein n=1 Tax=unclassified Vibrio TaxID=2614977 RepID=UPI0014839C71|nr:MULTISPECIES: DUF3630 family protein [unclassified Vibrio]NNN45370.1 DUF3630 family protein [Vibrio sp. 1-1(7)]NNN73346.1 DUF3630 family protein [Vibrio sp. 12-2(3-a)]